MQKALIVLGVGGALIVKTVPGAWAGWGCGAEVSTPTAGNFRVANWAHPTEAEARTFVCTGYDNCRLISCSDNVDSYKEALAIWQIQKIECGGAGQPQCK
jgi:hypothetical protein